MEDNLVNLSRPHHGIRLEGIFTCRLLQTCDDPICIHAHITDITESETVHGKMVAKPPWDNFPVLWASCCAHTVFAMASEDVRIRQFLEEVARGPYGYRHGPGGITPLRWDVGSLDPIA